ncbi:MAG TPA: biopolymer transporter ExbD [Pseudomonadales bacterium]|nr:biopolymer transporter ExbD [Pseudomonadales bacterium]HNL92589.1 biopolymer transporter ExbD [Pseudomonadales bacterium]HNN86462.1 biopolymer transporter ExbD [Pseudomonadales bacterium]
MKIRKRQRQDDYINVVPFIDILLVLLIFFMVSSRFTHNAELKLDLPTAEDPSGQQRQPDTVELVVAEDGSFSINDRVLADNKPETLRKALSEVAGDRTDIPLILSADAKAQHQAVVTAMDVAGQLGFSRLSITTRRDENAD